MRAQIAWVFRQISERVINPLGPRHLWLSRDNIPALAPHSVIIAAGEEKKRQIVVARSRRTRTTRFRRSDFFPSAIRRVNKTLAKVAAIARRRGVRSRDSHYNIQNARHSSRLRGRCRESTNHTRAQWRCTVSPFFPRRFGEKNNDAQWNFFPSMAINISLVILRKSNMRPRLNLRSPAAETLYQTGRNQRAIRAPKIQLHPSRLKCKSGGPNLAPKRACRTRFFRAPLIGKLRKRQGYSDDIRDYHEKIARWFLRYVFIANAWWECGGWEFRLVFVDYIWNDR